MSSSFKYLCSCAIDKNICVDYPHKAGFTQSKDRIIELIDDETLKKKKKLTILLKDKLTAINLKVIQLNHFCKRDRDR